MNRSQSLRHLAKLLESRVMSASEVIKTVDEAMQDATVYVSEIHVEPIDEIKKVSYGIKKVPFFKVYEPFTEVELTQARLQLESVVRRFLTPVLQTLAETISTEKDDETKRYAEAEKTLSALCIVYRGLGVFTMLKKPDKPEEADTVLVPNYMLARLAEHFRNGREKTSDILNELIREVRDELDNCVAEIEEENLGFVLPTCCEEGYEEETLNERAHILSRHERQERVENMPYSDKKPESGAVFGIISRMTDLDYLPKKGNPWRAYYQLKFAKETVAFDSLDIENAKAYIKKQGLSLPVFLQFLNEYIRRNTGEQIYSHPVTIQTKDGEETLQIPIYGTRDYGEFSGVVLMCYRLAHPDCPADTQPGAFRVTSLPCALAVVERNSVSQCVFVDPFRIENGERRVASLAFGEGTKDKRITFIKWKLLPENPGTLPEAASMLPPLPFGNLGKEDSAAAAIWSVESKRLELSASLVCPSNNSIPPTLLPHEAKVELSPPAKEIEKQKREGERSGCLIIAAVLFALFFGSAFIAAIMGRCSSTTPPSAQPVSPADKGGKAHVSQ